METRQELAAARAVVDAVVARIIARDEEAKLRRAREIARKLRGRILARCFK